MMARSVARGVALAAALIAMPAHAVQGTPQPPARICVTPQQGSAVAVQLLPELLRQTAARCGPRISAGSPLRSDAAIGRYRRAADASATQAMASVADLLGPQIAALPQQVVLPMAQQLIARTLLERLDLNDCAAIDRLVTALQPLPPRQLADALVAAIEIGQKPTDRSPFCIAPAR